MATIFGGQTGNHTRLITSTPTNMPPLGDTFNEEVLVQHSARTPMHRGPWLWDSKYYVVAMAYGAGFFDNVYRTTDAGATWTTEDEIWADNPSGTFYDFAVGGVNFIAHTCSGPRFDLDKNAGRIYMTTSHAVGGPTNYLGLHYMDLTTREWVHDIAGVGPNFNSFFSGGSNDTYWAYNRVMAVKPNGNVVIFYCEKEATGDKYNLYGVEVTISGATGTWGTPFLISDRDSDGRHSIPMNVVMSPAGDRMHLFYLAFVPNVSKNIQFGSTEANQLTEYRHVVIDLTTNALGQDVRITSDVNFLLATSRPVWGEDPADTGKLLVVIDSSEEEAFPAHFISKRYVWQADEGPTPTWSRIDTNIPFPHTLVGEDFFDDWVGDFDLYGSGAAITVFYHDGEIHVLTSTDIPSGDSFAEMVEAFVWEHVWDGSAWVFEEVEHIVNPLPGFDFDDETIVDEWYTLGECAVVKYNGESGVTGYALIHARWGIENPTGSQYNMLLWAVGEEEEPRFNYALYGGIAGTPQGNWGSVSD